MSNEFIPTTNTTEPTEGLYESVAKLRDQCANLDLHDPFDTEGRQELAERALLLEHIAASLNIDSSDSAALGLALDCKDHLERLFPGYEHEPLLNLITDNPDIDEMINAVE